MLWAPISHFMIVQLQAGHSEEGTTAKGGREEEGTEHTSQPQPPSSPYHAPEVANKIKVYSIQPHKIY